MRLVNRVFLPTGVSETSSVKQERASVHGGLDSSYCLIQSVGNNEGGNESPLLAKAHDVMRDAEEKRDMKCPGARVHRNGDAGHLRTMGKETAH